MKEQMKEHEWVQGAAWGGPFVAYTVGTKIAEWPEFCACGAWRTGHLFDEGRVNYTYGIHYQEECPGPLPVHECNFRPGPAKPGWPLGLERCSCGSVRQPTRRGGYRQPSVAEVARYQALTTATVVQSGGAA